MILERSSKLLDFVSVVSDDKINKILYLINLKNITFCCRVGDKTRIEFDSAENWIELDMTLEAFYNGLRDTSIKLGKKKFTLDFGGVIHES